MVSPIKGNIPRLPEGIAEDGNLLLLLLLKVAVKIMLLYTAMADKNNIIAAVARKLHTIWSISHLFLAFFLGGFFSTKHNRLITN